MTARTLTLGRTRYPLVLPSIRDPRLHVAAVIITIHVLGQVSLHFRVTVPQILAAILTCAIIEIAITFWQKRAFVWPASAMLTGSGVALILRVVGTPADDPWNTYAWWVFAIIGGASLLTKYVIRWRGGNHVFNPSNIGLVAAFVLLGSSRVEPLDFWWAPLNLPMITAYAVIIGGGVLITRRLHLLPMAVTFWLVLSGGVGLLAGSGHCMTANWAFAPVCGADFWRVIVTSPEVLIFMFFMLTDPQTIPGGKVGRVVFAVLVGIASTLLLAPWTDEFGTKVGLLAGLVVICAARPIVDRLVPEPKSATDDFGDYATVLATGRPARGTATTLARLGVGALAVLFLGVGIVFAGSPARGVVTPTNLEALNRDPVVIDPATLPPITVSQEVIDFDHSLAGSEMDAVVVTLSQNLELENQALLRRDESILPLVDHGDRLIEMQGRLADAEATGTAVLRHYDFDSIDVSLLVPFGQQSGLSLGLRGRGTLTEDTVDAAGNVLSRQTLPFENTFAMRRATGARWLNVAVLP
jgi:Na+-translocating ferredoxin:NAD+ oxidoreductase RnfD subunit